MKAKDFLFQAGKTMEDRGKSYDKGGDEEEHSMGRTVEMFNIVTGHALTESEGWLMLALLKLVRQWSTDTYHHDLALDSVAYTALMAEALDAEDKVNQSVLNETPKVNEASITEALNQFAIRIREGNTLHESDLQGLFKVNTPVEIRNAMGDPIYNKKDMSDNG